jgi:predicted RNase H-like HicB family nuclease
MIDEALAHFREALKMHIDGIIEDGGPIPLPVTVAAEFIETPVQQAIH